MIIWNSINFPTVICLPAVCYFSREKPLVKSTAPGLFSIIFAFEIYFYSLLLSDLLIQKPKNTLLHFIIIYLFHVSVRSIYPIYYKFIYLFTSEGLTTPLTRRVASICSLCAGTVYIVLRGSHTGLITLASSLREIPTIDVLHHPFLFGEIPT